MNHQARFSLEKGSSYLEDVNIQDFDPLQIHSFDDSAQKSQKTTNVKHYKVGTFGAYVLH